MTNSESGFLKNCNAQQGTTGVCKESLQYKQGYPAIGKGFFLLQGKTVIITGKPFFRHRIFLNAPCSTLLGVHLKLKET